VDPVDPDSEPDPEHWFKPKKAISMIKIKQKTSEAAAADPSGSGSRLFGEFKSRSKFCKTKNGNNFQCKNFNFFLLKNCNTFILKPLRRTSCYSLQEKPPAFQEYIQHFMTFLHFLGGNFSRG